MKVLRYTLIGIFCNIILLQAQITKYHQTDYEVKMHHMEIVDYNSKYLKNPKGEFVWYNRSQRIIRGSGYILQNFTEDIKVTVQVYKFLSNEYRYFPITLGGEMCRSIKINIFGIGNLIKRTSNFSCPVYAGFYSMDNAIVDFSSFPPYMPSGQYKMRGSGIYRSETIVTVDFYGSVNTYITKWES